MPQALPYLIEIGKVLVVAAAEVAIDYAVSEILGLNDRPTPESQKVAIKQPIPPEQRAYGRGRLGGFYAYWTTVSGYTIDIIMQCKGPVQNPALHYYLNDDQVVMSGNVVEAMDDGRYRSGSSEIIRIFSRPGATPSPAYSEVIALALGQWTTNHRLDGVATLCCVAKGVKSESVQTIYPNGPVQASSEGDWLKVYDFRLDSTVPGGSGAHRRNNPATWAWSHNPVICWVHDELFEQGLDWDHRFAPTIEFLIDAANVCEEQIPKYGGGFVDRYSIFLVARSNTPPKDVRQQFIGAFDGLMIERGDGAFVVHAGVYREPTVIINEDRIKRFRWRKNRRTEDVCNSIVLSFLSPAHAYTAVETIPWTDPASIAALGESTKGLSSNVVTENSQIRRLGKIAFGRINCEFDGTIVMSLSDDETELEQRWVRVQNRLGPPSMWDVVCEVRGLTIDLANRLVIMEVIKASPGSYEWAGASEEGAPPAVPDGQIRVEVGTPTLQDAAVVFTGGVPRLVIVIDDPDRDDYGYAIRWRDTASGLMSWSVEYPDGEAVTGGGMELMSGVVPPDTIIEFSVAYLAGNGMLGPWANFGPAGLLDTAGSDAAQDALNLYTDQLTANPPDSQKARLKKLIQSLMDGGVWPKIDRLAILAVDTAQAAQVDLRYPTKRWTPAGTTTFLAYRGTTGDGSTGYVDAGETLAAQAHYALNAATLFAWDRSAIAANGSPSIATASASSSSIFPRSASGNFGVASNSANVNSVVPTSAGLSAFSRSASNAVSFYKNGAAVGSSTTASTSIGAGNITLLRSSTSYSARQIAAAGVASNLSAGEQATLHAALSTYLVAVGAA